MIPKKHAFYLLRKIMIVYLKNGSLWIKDFSEDHFIDITQEGEKYLFGTNIDCSEAILGDFFKVLNKNSHLRAIFVEDRKKAYKNMSFKNLEMQHSLLQPSQLSQFLHFYGSKTDNEIHNLCLQQNKTLDHLEFEVVKEDIDNSISIDFVGVRDGEIFSMSLSPVDGLYYTPLKIKFYTEFYQHTQKYKKERKDTKSKLPTHQFFYELTKNLNEMILKSHNEALYI